MFLLETERLIITEFTPDMAQAVHENSLDEDNRRFVPDEVFETVEDAAAITPATFRRFRLETAFGKSAFTSAKIHEERLRHRSRKSVFARYHEAPGN